MSKDVCLAKKNTAPLSSGRIVPRVTIVKGNSILVPRERPNIKHSIATLVQDPTTANTSACTDAGAALAPLLSW